MVRRLWILSLSLLCLAWYLDSTFIARKPPLFNDDFSVFFDPLKVVLPQTESDIVETVRHAAKNGQQVRVLGSGHSRNGLSYSRDIILSLQRYKGVVDLDRQAQQVTVRAGSTLEEVVRYLDKNGLTLGVLPAILEQTIAGTISTATHGCRTDYGNLATLVTKLKMVTGEGRIVTLSASDEDDSMFKAALVSLGVLGVITEVTLQCEPSFTLEEIMEKASLDSCLGNLNKLAHSAEHVKLWVEMYSQSCDIYRFNRTEKEVQMNSLLFRNLKMRMWEPFLFLASWLPSFAPSIIKHSVLYGNIFSPEYSQVGKSFEVLTYPLFVPRNKQSEFSVEMDDCPSALRAFKSEMERWRPASIFMEVRFVSPDDIWMSMNYHRQSCQITVIIYNPSAETKEAFFSSLQQVLIDMKLRPRPHFGKYYNLSSEKLSDVYPKFSDFKRVRSLVDPKDVFLNEVLAPFF